MKNSTSITGLIVPVITREVIMENETVDLNVLFLKFYLSFILLKFYLQSTYLPLTPRFFPKCTVPFVHVVL